MSDSAESVQRSGTCACCGEVVEADNETAGPFAGRFLCEDCWGEEMTFVTECLDCDWTYEAAGRQSNHHNLRTRVQQEGNSHENKKRVFDDESHETVWRRVA